MTNAADFDAFVLAYGPRLLRTARHLAADDAAGEDLLQTALTVVWSRWWRLQDTSGPAAEAYARRVLVTRAIRAGRRRWNGERATASLPDRAAVEDGVEDRLVLRHALASLPPRWRAVVVLRYGEDLPEAEVARLLGCSVGTVKSSASRALARLREVPDLHVLVDPDCHGHGDLTGRTG